MPINFKKILTLGFTKISSEAKNDPPKNGKELTTCVNNTVDQKLLGDSSMSSKSQFEVRSRQGAKGPGRLLTVVGTKDDAEKIVADLKAENRAGVEVFMSERPETVIDTHATFTAKRKAENEKLAARDAALAKLSPAEREALGIENEATATA